MNLTKILRLEEQLEKLKAENEVLRQNQGKITSSEGRAADGESKEVSVLSEENRKLRVILGKLEKYFWGFG